MKRMIAVLLLATLITHCSVERNSSAVTTNNAIVNGKMFTAAFQQRAAEYKALCYQAYHLARLKLDAALQKNYNRPVAIITDIDETVLDNSAYAVHRALQGKDYDIDSWIEWTSKATADTVPGAYGFLQYAASKGVSVFYITNREERERVGTLKNLQKFGLPNAVDAHLLLKQTTSGKEARRQQVMKDHEVLLLIGDNLSDHNAMFDKGSQEKRNSAADELMNWFGDRYIVLPNPNYGDWELALYKYNYNFTPAQKDSAMRSLLKGY